MNHITARNASQHVPLRSGGFLREGIMEFSPDDAAFVLERYRYSRQRDETRAKDHIAALAEQMRRGLWLPKTQLDFAVVRGGDNLTLVNGHHRMHAQIAAGVPIRWNIVVHECESEGEIRALYSRFDTVLRKRSSSNILTGIGFHEDTGLAKEASTALWNAATVINAGMRFERGVILTDDRRDVAMEYAPAAQAIEELLREAIPVVRRRVRMASRYSVALVTMRYQPEVASDFWGGLFRDDALAKGDPRKTLLQDMDNRSGSSGLMAAHLLAAARAWSTFFEGRHLKSIRVMDHPVKIAGTPFIARP